MRKYEISHQWEKFISILKEEVKPALGCTEPVSLALAAATAASHLSAKAQRVDAWVSPNLMKNGMGVTIPGTGMKGLPMAAALGALCGVPQEGLEVLKAVTPNDTHEAKIWVEQNLVQVGIQPDCHDILYARVAVYSQDECVTVTIAGHHTNILNITKGDEAIFSAPVNTPQTNATSLADFFSCVTLKHILEFAESAPFEHISFILDAADLNDALSREGLCHQWGLHIGFTLEQQRAQKFVGNDLMTTLVIRTSAASDARMGGASLPAMSNSGSGNQGIAATMPVVIIADYLQADREVLARALILSHLSAIYIHSKLPTLSALCAASTASMGAAAGMAWLMGCQYQAISRVINNMVGDISGIICDGASNSCAMKVSTGATSAWKAVLMVMGDTSVSDSDGIVCADVEDSLNNLGALASNSMKYIDTQVIDIMVNKASSSFAAN